MGINIGKIISIVGTACSIVGMILDKHSQNRLIKQTIVEEVAKAVNK